MKKLSQLNQTSGKKIIEVSDNSINYISVDDLKKYLSIVNSYLLDETKEIINYLIVNNNNYIKDLAPANEQNALAYFYNNGPYKEEHFKELYALIGKVVKQHRTIEIPVFQTVEEFNGIISKTLSFDEVVLDFESETGRNNIAKKFTPLCYRIAKDWMGKTNLGFEELQSAAFEGLTWAINNYGKKSKKMQKREANGAEETNIDKYKQTTFVTFASYMIRFAILEAVKHEGQLVRIPANKQSEERKEKGYNTKNNTISGDQRIGNDEKGKTVFDYVSNSEDAGKSVDDADIEMVWKMLMQKLKSSNKISDKMIDAWVQFNQLNGAKKKKNKDIAAELGISQSNVTYYCSCINNYIKKNPELSKIARHLIMLYNESLQRYYREEDNDEPVQFTIIEQNYNND